VTTVSTVDPVKPVFSIIEKDYLEFADRISAIMAHPWTSESCRMPRELLTVHLPDYKEAGRVLLLKEVSTPD
jgi:hypothetical protein